LLQICLLGLVLSDNSTIGDHSMIEDTSEINTGNLAVDPVDQVKRFSSPSLFTDRNRFTPCDVCGWIFETGSEGNPSFPIGSET